MKSLLISLLFICLGVAGIAQSSKKANLSTSYEFRPRDNKVIDIGKLQNGTHTFYSADGNRLFLKIKNKQIKGMKFYTSDGKEVKDVVPAKNVSKSIQEGISGMSTCESCVSVVIPGEGTTRLCQKVACPDAQSLNKSLNTTR